MSDNETIAPETTQPDIQASGETDPVTPAVPDGAEEQQEGESSAGQSVPLNRFNEIYYKKSEAERRVAELESQAQTPQQSSQQRQAPQNTEGRPTLEQFDYDDGAYQEALVDWKLDQREQLRIQQQQQQQQQNQLNAFAVQQNQYMMQNKEYAELTTAADRAGIQFSPDIVNAVTQSKAGVQIHHHLLSNPHVLDDLNNMSPYQMMREVVALENKFATPKAQVSQAPDPISPGGHGSGVPPSPNMERLAKMNPDEYYAHMMAKRNSR